MKTSEDLLHFFQNDLMPALAKVDAKRKRIITLLAAVAMLVVAAIGATVFFFNDYNASPVAGNGQIEIGWLILFILIYLVGGFVIMAELSRNKSFHEDFKTLVIGRIMQFINPSFKYKSTKYVPMKLFMESHMIQYLPNKSYEGDDYVTGDLDGAIHLEFSEIVARRKSNEAKQDDEGNIVFKGLFFVAQVPNNWPGFTVLTPKRVDMTKAKYPDKVNLRVMEAAPSELLTEFNVYTSDEASSVAILQPPIVAQLLNFHQTNAVQLSVSFHANHVFVGIQHEKDLFEPSLWKSLMDFKIIDEFFNDLKQAITIVEAVGSIRQTQSA